MVLGRPFYYRVLTMTHVRFWNCCILFADTVIVGVQQQRCTKDPCLVGNSVSHHAKDAQEEPRNPWHSWPGLRDSTQNRRLNHTEGVATYERRFPKSALWRTPCQFFQVRVGLAQAGVPHVVLVSVPRMPFWGFHLLSSRMGPKKGGPQQEVATPRLFHASNDRPRWIPKRSVVLPLALSPLRPWVSRTQLAAQEFQNPRSWGVSPIFPQSHKTLPPKSWTLVSCSDKSWHINVSSI